MRRTGSPAADELPTVHVNGVEWSHKDRVELQGHFQAAAEILLRFQHVPRTQRGSMWRVEVGDGVVYKFYVQGYAKRGSAIYERQKAETDAAIAEFEAEHGPLEETEGWLTS